MTPRILILAATLALVAVAYGISNLILEVSLLLYDPYPMNNSEEKEVAIIHTTTSRGKRQRPNPNGMTTATPQSSSSSSTTLELKMVTMNIAGLVPSQSAPDSWSTALQKEALRAELLASDPDIIALQECPSQDWAASGIFNSDNNDDNDKTMYRLVGSAPSHAGFVSLVVRAGLDATLLDLGEDYVPIAAATVSWHGKQIVVASVHLQPFEQGSLRRKEQITTLMAASAAADALIFAGDTNMRDSEDATMEESLHLMDAWKVAGASESTRFSWDTMSHMYGEDKKKSSEWQNLYYGAATRAYQRRYDRVYIRGSPLQQQPVLQVHVPAFDLIANQPVSESRYHFLSDHFGIALRLELNWTAP